MASIRTVIECGSFLKNVQWPEQLCSELKQGFVQTTHRFCAHCPLRPQRCKMNPIKSNKTLRWRSTQPQRLEVAVVPHVFYNSLRVGSARRWSGGRHRNSASGARCPATCFLNNFIDWLHASGAEFDRSVALFLFRFGGQVIRVWPHGVLLSTCDRTTQSPLAYTLR